MKVFADRVKERAAELGFSQAEVARRSGVSERRMGHYVADRSEPDLALLIKIAAALGVTPNYLLGVDPKTAMKKNDEASRLRGRIAAACAVMDEASLPLAVTLVEAVIEHGRQGSP
jgi:transcriptional regulator with XRE-family HTH domain